MLPLRLVGEREHLTDAPQAKASSPGSALGAVEGKGLPKGVKIYILRVSAANIRLFMLM